MSDILTIAGSPSVPSRSSAVLDHIRNLVEADGLSTDFIRVRDLDAEELLYAQFDGASVRQALAHVEAARGVIIATPVYKDAYSGVLKAFLDLLPQDALAGKVVLPIATGGSPAHLLAIDYALKPVLSALGAHHILNGVYIQDSQLQYKDGFQLDASIETRLLATLQTLIAQLNRPEPIAIGK